MKNMKKIIVLLSAVYAISIRAAEAGAGANAGAGAGPGPDRTAAMSVSIPKPVAATISVSQSQLDALAKNVAQAIASGDREAQNRCMLQAFRFGSKQAVLDLRKAGVAWDITESHGNNLSLIAARYKQYDMIISFHKFIGDKNNNKGESLYSHLDKDNPVFSLAAIFDAIKNSLAIEDLIDTEYEQCVMREFEKTYNAKPGEYQQALNACCFIQNTPSDAPTVVTDLRAVVAKEEQQRKDQLEAILEALVKTKTKNKYNNYRSIALVIKKIFVEDDAEALETILASGISFAEVAKVLSGLELIKKHCLLYLLKTHKDLCVQFIKGQSKEFRARTLGYIVSGIRLQDEQQVEAIRILIQEAKVNPNNKVVTPHDTMVETLPIWLAVLNDNFFAVKMLLECGANPSTSDLKGRMLYFHEWRSAETRALLKPHTNINYQDENGDTALHKALRSGSREILQQLYEDGAQTNIPNNKGERVVRVADNKGNPAFVFIGNNDATADLRDKKEEAPRASNKGAAELKREQDIVERERRRIQEAEDRKKRLREQELINQQKNTEKKLLNAQRKEQEQKDKAAEQQRLAAAEEERKKKEAGAAERNRQKQLEAAQQQREREALKEAQKVQRRAEQERIAAEKKKKEQERKEAAALAENNRLEQLEAERQRKAAEQEKQAKEQAEREERERKEKEAKKSTAHPKVAAQISQVPTLASLAVESAAQQPAQPVIAVFATLTKEQQAECEQELAIFKAYMEEIEGNTEYEKMKRIYFVDTFRPLQKYKDIIVQQRYIDFAKQWREKPNKHQKKSNANLLKHSVMRRDAARISASPRVAAPQEPLLTPINQPAAPAMHTGPFMHPMMHPTMVPPHHMAAPHYSMYPHQMPFQQPDPYAMHSGMHQAPYQMPPPQPPMDLTVAPAPGPDFYQQQPLNTVAPQAMPMQQPQVVPVRSIPPGFSPMPTVGAGIGVPVQIAMPDSVVAQAAAQAAVAIPAVSDEQDLIEKLGKAEKTFEAMEGILQSYAQNIIPKVKSYGEGLKLFYSTVGSKLVNINRDFLAVAWLKEWWFEAARRGLAKDITHMIPLFVRAGLDINIRQNQKTALMLATENGHTDIMGILLTKHNGIRTDSERAAVVQLAKDRLMNNNDTHPMKMLARAPWSIIMQTIMTQWLFEKVERSA